LKKFAPKKEESSVVLETGVTFDLQTLKTSLPEGVSASSKEMYLSDAQFQEVFKTSKD